MDAETTAVISRFIPGQDLRMRSEKGRRTTPASSSTRLPQYWEWHRSPGQQRGHHGRSGPDALVVIATELSKTCNLRVATPPAPSTKHRTLRHIQLPTSCLRIPLMECRQGRGLRTHLRHTDISHCNAAPGPGL